MCLIAFAWQTHPRYALVLVGNRDEFHARPTAALARWPDAPQLLAGQDQLARGTWLGVSERGRLAAVTNVRLPAEPRPGLRSRGALPVDFLRGDRSAAAAAAALTPELPQYGLCNLLMFDTRQAIYAQNHPQAQAREIAPGIYGLSNATLDSPWPKTRKLRTRLAQWMGDIRTESDGQADFSALFDALADESRPDDAELPDTGVGIEHERLLGPAFIRGTDYGTRCSTVIVIDHQGRGQIAERRFGADGVALGETHLPFTWSTTSLS